MKCYGCEQSITKLHWYSNEAICKKCNNSIPGAMFIQNTYLMILIVTILFVGGVILKMLPLH